MDIAIIGAGNVGKALAGSFKRAGHQVTITAKHSEHAADAALATGTRAAASNVEAIAGSDFVVLAVPETALEALAAEISDVARGKVVVDVSNRPTPNPAGAPTSVAEELQARLPNSRVVKAFNTLFASRQANPEINGLKADAFVAACQPGRGWRYAKIGGNRAEALAAVLSGADRLTASGTLQLCQGRHLELAPGLGERAEFLDGTEFRRKVVTLEQNNLSSRRERADASDRLEYDPAFEHPMGRACPLCVEPRIELAIGGVDLTTAIFHANPDRHPAVRR